MEPILRDFLMKKGVIPDEKKAVVINKLSEGKKEKYINYQKNILNLKQIVEEKPSRKKIIEYLKEKMQAYEKEFLD